VSVEARCAAGEVEFRVVDTGIGIPPEALSRIFEAFHQEVGLPRRRGGVGLGLYIVRRFVALLEGTIDVESKMGEGSTFTLRIPERTEVRRAPAPEATVERAIA
jgi:signal transduction histidine kinase